MPKKKVIIDNLPLSTGHAVRGMGMYTKNLISSVKSVNQKKLEINDKNLQNENVKADLIHYPYFDLFRKTLSESKQANKIVVTVPDLIPLIFPKYYQPGFRGARVFRKNKKLLKQQADAIITISETSKKDIVRFLDYNPDNVYVTYLATNFIYKKLPKNKLSEIRNKFNLPKKFILYVGDVNLNKNIETLIKANIKSDIDLVIVGKQASDLQTEVITNRGPRDIFRNLIGQKHPELKHFEGLNKLFKSNKVHRLGFLSNEELNAVWNMAEIYVQPSLYEGFGMPVLEAMQAGVPVIVSKTQALVEISGDAAEKFEIGDVDDLSSKIDEILSSSKKRKLLIDKGLKHVKNFSWEKHAKEVIDIYKNVLDIS